MQMHQPLEPEDFALIKGKSPTASEVEAYCDEFDSAAKASCLNESWPLFRTKILTPNGLVEFCGKVEDKFRGRCFSAMFYVVTAQLDLSSDKVFDFCSNISERQSQCFANAASRMIEVDYKFITRAVDLCKKAEKFDSLGACFEELVTYSTYNFHKGSDEYYKICESLPDKWKAKCLNK